jgi:hypothetical protein
VPSLKYLEHLQLSTNMIGDRAVLSLTKALALGSNPALTGVFVSRCGLTLAGLVPLVRALKHCPAIATLDVRENDLASEASASLTTPPGTAYGDPAGVKTLTDELAAIAPNCRLQSGAVQFDPQQFAQGPGHAGF